MTLDDFRTALSDELGLSNTLSTEQPKMDKEINKARDRVLIDTGCYVNAESITISTLTAVASLNGAVTDYQLPVEVLEIVDMYLQTSGWNPRLDRVSIPDLVEYRRMSLPANSPTQVYALAGANLLMFWPLPSTTDVIEMYYIPVPTDLSSGTDDPSTLSLGGIPKQLHEAIFYAAAKKLASYDDDQTSAQGQRYSDWYDKEITRYHKLLRRRGGIRNQRAVPGGSNRRRPFHDNSIYYSGMGG